MSSKRRTRAAVLAIALGALTLACSSDEPGDFVEFADRIAAAVNERDVAFFIERIEGDPYVCTEEDVAGNAALPIGETPACEEAGFEFEAVRIARYGRPGIVTTTSALATDLEVFFRDALPNESDQYGLGAVELYATAAPLAVGDEAPVRRTAIITAIQATSAGVPGRFARGIDFEYADGRWLIRSETAAGFPIAVELLDPATAGTVYQEWRPYE